MYKYMQIGIFYIVLVDLTIMENVLSFFVSSGTQMALPLTSLIT